MEWAAVTAIRDGCHNSRIYRNRMHGSPDILSLFLPAKRRMKRSPLFVFLLLPLFDYAQITHIWALGDGEKSISI
jgi:hypothetical protein